MSDAAPVPSPGVVEGPVIKVGKPTPAAITSDEFQRVIEVRVQQSVGVSARAEIRFRDEDFKMVDGDKFVVGAGLKVSFESRAGVAAEVFDGEVVAVASEQGTSERHELVVTAYDKSHRLGRTTTVTTYLTSSYSDVVSAIAGRGGLTADCDASLGQPQFAYLMQTSTDRDYLDEIAYRTGSEWFVDGSKLVVRPRDTRTSTVTLKYGRELSRFKARYSVSEHNPKVTVRSWDVGSKQAINVDETSALVSPKGVGTSTLASSNRTKAGDYKGALFTASAVVESEAEASALAAGLGSRLASSQLIAKGEASGTPSLKAGSEVTIEGVGNKLSAKYYVTAVDHVFTRGRGYITRFTAGGLEPNSLVDMMGANGGRLGSFAQSGLTIGIVTNNGDDDHPGRVKMKLPMISDNDETNWARVVTLGGGKDRGLMFMPAVDDEVLVGFEQGDIRRPYVIGGLWGSQAAPPIAKYNEGANQSITSSGMKTVSGTTFTFDDKEEGKRNVNFLLADGKTKFYLGEDKIELWAADGMPVQVKSKDATITINADGDLTVKAAKITIEATDDLTLKGNNVKIEGDAKVDVKGNSVSVQAQTSLKLEGSADASLKGGMVKIN